MSRVTLVICLLSVLSIIAHADEDCKPVSSLPSKMCCKMPNLMDSNSEIKAIRDFVMTCVKKVFDMKEFAAELSKSSLSHKAAECIQECILENAGSLKDGKVNTDVFMQLMFDFLGKDDAWKAVLDSGFKKCEAEVKNVGSDALCKSGSMQFGICLMKDMYMNCPGKFWTDSAECKEEKALVGKCSLESLLGISGN